MGLQAQPWDEWVEVGQRRREGGEGHIPLQNRDQQGEGRGNEVELADTADKEPFRFVCSFLIY